jgi:hypothetical protein
MGTHVLLPVYRCLRCGHAFDRASGVGEPPPPAPTPGSVSLCIRCGHLAIFTDAEPWLREATDAERVQIDADPDIRRIRRCLAEAIAERPS